MTELNYTIDKKHISQKQIHRNGKDDKYLEFLSIFEGKIQCRNGLFSTSNLLSLASGGCVGETGIET